MNADIIAGNGNGIKNPSTNGSTPHDGDGSEKLLADAATTSHFDVKAILTMVEKNTGTIEAEAVADVTTTATTNPGVKLLLTHLDHVTPDVRPFITGGEFLR